MATPRPLDDLGPDFDRRWKQAPRTRRRELIGELRDLYLMLEKKDAPILSRLGIRLDTAAPAAGAAVPTPPPVVRPAPGLIQGDLLAGSGPSLDSGNPFLPRATLDRLHQSQSQASASLRRLMRQAEERTWQPTDPAPATGSGQGAPKSPEQALRQRLEAALDELIESHLAQVRRTLQEQLRREMEALIAEHASRSGLRL